MRERPARHRRGREIVGLVLLSLLSVGAGHLIVLLTPSASRWLAIGIVTVFLGLTIGVVHLMTRSRP